MENKISNNLILDSIDVFEYSKNISKRQFTYCTKINNELYNKNYDSFYGRTNSFSRVYAVRNALYYGVLANVGQIFKIIIGDLPPVISSFLIAAGGGYLENLTENTNILRLDIYEIAQNIFLSLSYFFSLVNDRIGRYYIDSALLEKQSYQFARENQSCYRNIFEKRQFKFALKEFCGNHLSIHGEKEADQIANIITKLNPNDLDKLNSDQRNQYHEFTDELITIIEEFPIEKGLSILEKICEKLSPYNQEKLIEKFTKLIIDKDIFRFLSEEDNKAFPAIFKRIIALNDKIELPPYETKSLPEYSYFINLLIEKIGLGEAFKLVSDLPSERKIKHLIGLYHDHDPHFDLKRLKHFKYFFQKNPGLLGVRFLSSCDIFHKKKIEKEEVKNFLKEIIKAEPKAFVPYLNFCSRYDNFELSNYVPTGLIVKFNSLTNKKDGYLTNINEGHREYEVFSTTWEKHQNFIRELVEENLNNLLVPYAKYLQSLSKKFRDCNAQTVNDSPILEIHEKNKEFALKELAKRPLGLEGFDLLSNEAKNKIKNFLLSVKYNKTLNQTILPPRPLKLEIVKMIINSSDLEL